jgi:hypothetical protein
MEYNQNTLIPIIPASEYDAVAEEFLERYYPEALLKPQKIPILDIAREKLNLDVRFIPISEEQEIYGMTIFADGLVEVYNPDEELYDCEFFKRKTVLIDPVAVEKTNIGCRNNTIAHECVHWYKHRLYYKMQQITLPRYAKYCKCHVDQIPYDTEEENIMENHAVGIAPRILMPKRPFMEMARQLDIEVGKDNRHEISLLADFFDVSKKSVSIRLEECGIL